jgi:cytochrome c biogenesis protein CcdA
MKRKGLSWGLFFLLFLVASLILSSAPLLAANDSNSGNDANTSMLCAVYFTGANCPHCAKVKPVVEKILNDTPNLVLIRYEVQQNPENAPVLDTYSTVYGVDPYIPTIIFAKGDYLQGDTPIITGLKNKLNSLKSNPCPLPDGSSISFESLQKNISILPNKPDILLCGKNMSVNNTCNVPTATLTVWKIIGYALYDAINPCVYAMLVLILTAILTQNPDKKRRVLFAGLAFAAAVFIVYFIYGILIIIFFQFIQQLTLIRVVLYKAMAVLAIVLGLVNIRDFISYRPGRMGSEMPLMFRPKAKKLISKVTSPAGAFVVGAFITLFLAPCTIGPYLITGGILSSMSLVSTFPWLLLYNFVFVLPIIVLTLIVFGGIASVENVSGWRDRNLKYIHLAEGVLILILGILMFFGWLGF